MNQTFNFYGPTMGAKLFDPKTSFEIKQLKVVFFKGH